MGLSWFNSQLALLGETFSQYFTGVFPTYGQTGGAVRVPFNAAFCKVFAETFNHTGGGIWVVDDFFVSVARNDLGALPAIGVQFPGQVQTGRYAEESMIAISVLMTTLNPVEYLQPQGMIAMNVEGNTTAMVQVRRSNPSGAVVGTTIVTNRYAGTISVLSSLVGAEANPVWGDIYVLTAFAINNAGIMPITIIPGGTFAMVHTPVGVDMGAQVFTAGISPGPKTGETIISASPTITVAVEQGVMIPQAHVNVTVAANSAVLVQVKQFSSAGTVVGVGYFTNPLPGPVTVRIDATGYDPNPVWDFTYVLTIQSINAAGSTNTVTVNAGGSFRMVHRRTGAAPAQVDVVSGVVMPNTYTGSYEIGAWIATSNPVAVATQIGYLQAAGILHVTITAGAMLQLRVCQRDAAGKVIGSVVIANQTAIAFTLPIAIQGYDPEPRWGDSYVVTGLSTNAALTPIPFTVTGGTFAMLHTRLN